MGRRYLYVAALLSVFVHASSETPGSEIFSALVNGKSNRSETAVVIDLSDGNVEKVKKFWRMYNISNYAVLSFGVLDGSGYETQPTLENLQEVLAMVEDLKSPSQKLNASSNDLFRYLLKTMSLMPSESDIILFTGRTTKEEPLQKACIDKLKEKRFRLFVIWTGNTTEGMDAIRAVAEVSNGSLQVLDAGSEKVEIRTTESTQKSKPEEIAAKSAPLPKMVAPSDDEENDFAKRLGEISIQEDDKTLKSMQRVRFPQESKGVTNNEATDLSMEKQQSRSIHLIPVRVEVSSRSKLECTPGTQHQIQYDVKNNLHVALPLTFVAGQPRNLAVINIQPQRYVLQPLETMRVDVTFQSAPNVVEGGEGSLVFGVMVEGGGVTPLPTLVYFTNKEISDNWDPKVTYTYLGSCRGHDKPDTCDSGEWKFKAVFQDETSGLKKVLSEPYGLYFESQFIAGTKLPVNVFYTASCCQPKIEIWAEDGQGNYVKRSLDVNNQGLLAGEIAAVVLGVLLLICVIIGVIVAVIIVKKRKQNKLIIPRYQGSSN